MPYMLLTIEPVGQRRERDEAAGRETHAQMVCCSESLAVSDSLASTDRSVRAQVRNGHPRVIDGPFAGAAFVTDRHH